MASEDHRAADEAVDTVEAVEPEADVTVRPESEPAAPVAAGIGELPPAVPDPNAGVPNAAEPVLDPDAPDRPQRRHPPSAGVGGGAGVGPRPPPGRRQRPTPRPTRRPTRGRPRPRTDRRPDRRAGRRTGRRPAVAPAGPVDAVGAGSATSDGAEPSPATRPESPDGGTAPDGSEPIAGSNGVVAPGADTAEFPSAPEPVAGSNGAVGADGNGATPRRRRRSRQSPGRPPAARVRRVTPGGGLTRPPAGPYPVLLAHRDVDPISRDHTQGAVVDVRHRQDGRQAVQGRRR